MVSKDLGIGHHERLAKTWKCQHSWVSNWVLSKYIVLSLYQYTGKYEEQKTNRQTKIKWQRLTIKYGENVKTGSSNGRETLEQGKWR